jgi:hypothetical protein
LSIQRRLLLLGKGVWVSAEQNKEPARRAIGIWSTGDVDAADEIYGPDYVNHQHHDPDDPRDLRSDLVRFQRAAAIVEVDVTLSVGAHMQHIYPIYWRHARSGRRGGDDRGLDPYPPLVNGSPVSTRSYPSSINRGKIPNSPLPRLRP